MKRGRKQSVYHIRICKECHSNWIHHKPDLTFKTKGKYWCSDCQMFVKTKMIKTSESKR